jgi:hypothetical protein
MFYPNYLIHFNKNHSSSSGQFISGDGDGDGVLDDHHNYEKNKYIKNNWAIRKGYQNKDGSLTEKGQKAVSARKQNEENEKKMAEEGKKLFKQSKKLKEDFYDYESVDADYDYDSFIETAKKYGLNTKNFSEAKKTAESFAKNNVEYIRSGREIVNKMKDVDSSYWKNKDMKGGLESAKASTMLAAVLGLPILTVAGVVDIASETANYNKYKHLDTRRNNG